ncbi:30S ribosomal protein THX [Spirosoma pulveris]
MGRGDKKSKRGKISRGSYGKTRPRKAQKNVPVAKQPETDSSNSL